MGDMLRKAYGCGGFAPYEYEWPENWEGKVFSFEDDFPTAEKMRNRKEELNTSDMVILGEIRRLLDGANEGTSITYEGCLSSAVKKYLCEKGYKINTGRQYNTEYTMISWRE